MWIFNPCLRFKMRYLLLVCTAFNASSHSLSIIILTVLSQYTHGKRSLSLWSWFTVCIHNVYSQWFAFVCNCLKQFSVISLTAHSNMFLDCFWVLCFHSLYVCCKLASFYCPLYINICWFQRISLFF
jgi:hypothetical protein